MSHLLFATGGTGGHIYPALAIAREALSRGYSVSFLGQAEGMEARIVPREGFKFHGVMAGKWDRQRPDPRQALRAGQGLWQALRLVKRLKPDLVVGFGGFASFPGLAAARLLRVPYVLHEGNAYPGRVVRWFAGRAAAVAVTSEAARPHLSARVRVVVTGFPVREERVGKAEARAQLGLPAGGVLALVMGGSQGSRVLNEAVPEAYRSLNDPPLVLHGTGERWLEPVRARLHQLGVPQDRYHTSGFLDARLAWSAADVAIVRAGISTLAEAAYHGVPVLMVPLPSAAENHQLHNARAVAAARAGWLVEERDLSTLASTWQQALDSERRRQASAAARRLSPAGAAAALVRLIDEQLSAKHSAPAGKEPA